MILDSMGPAQWIIIAVMLQRLLELILARRNTLRLLSEGGVEVGGKHYLPIVMLHVAWLVALFLRTPSDVMINLWLIGFFILLQVGRIWVITSLGRFWTTRIITLPNAPLVTRGPYRWLRHPNYVIVAMELAVLPLAFSDWLIALFFSLANAFLMHFRIPAENRILETRQTPNDEYQSNC